MVVAMRVTDSTSEMLLEALYRAICAALDLNGSPVSALGREFACLLVHPWCKPIATTIGYLSVLVRNVMLWLLVVLMVVGNALVMLMTSIFNEFALLLALVEIV